MRIVSLIPEATSILQALGLGDQLVQATPSDVADARPDLIFTSKTDAGDGVPRAAVRRAVSALRPRPAVYALEPHSLGEILSDVKTVGDATGQQGTARALIEALRVRIDAITLRSAEVLMVQQPPRVVCLQSTDPPIAAGWWLAELVGLAGGLDILDGVGRPPRTVTWEQIRAAQPELVIDLTPRPPLRRGEGEQVAQPLLSAPERGLGGEVSGWSFGEAIPGPGAVDLLERLAAHILPDSPGLRGAARR